MLKPTSASLIFLASLLAAPGQVAAAESATGQSVDPPANAGAAAQPSDSESLAKKLSNPIASLISVPFQLNADFGGGLTDDGDKYTLNVQPVIPISITSGTNMIIRTIVPIVYQDNLRGDDESESGLGDTVQSIFFSPKAPTSGGLIWGAGPVFLFPTATDRFTGGDKWGVGPTFVVLKQKGPVTVGALANHIWSIAGKDDRPDVSATFLQPFVSYTTKRATTFTLNTESTYDWKSEQWSVPVNVQISQLVRLGKLPVSFGVGGRYYVVRPEGGPDWGMRFITTLLFPKK